MPDLVSPRRFVQRCRAAAGAPCQTRTGLSCPRAAAARAESIRRVTASNPVR
ncbi:MAG: hypothetical protein U1F07_09840 [Rubrivivax sp.]